MNILWLSWRDIKNPTSGGAEKVAIEVAKRFVRDGSSVTIFTSSFKKAKPQERVSGVNIIRKGNQLTCRLHAFLYYRKNPNFDVVIDEINTIPFFTNFYARSKSVALIHQLARDFWFKQTVFPLNIIGYLIEPVWLKLYRNSPTLALGASTKKDLEKLGFLKIKTYKPGTDYKPQHITKKENLILFLGRLIPSKGPDHAIKAFKIIHKSLPDTKLVIAGRGKEKYLKKLKNLPKKLNLQTIAEFKGFVTEKEKINLLKKSKIVLIPSVREGWSLVVIEANTFECVPVAYNVSGLRDSIVNNQNGILTEPKPEALAQEAIRALEDDKLRLSMAREGLKESKKFSWENCYRDLKESLIK